MRKTESSIVCRLRAERDELADRNHALQMALATGGVQIRPHWLTKQQFEIMRYLRSKSPRVCRTAQIENWIYGLRSAVDIPLGNSLAVQFTKIRKRLPDGLSIETVNREGYRMPASAADVWDEIVK